jgi:hypothetical protein
MALRATDDENGPSMASPVTTVHGICRGKARGPRLGRALTSLIAIGIAVGGCEAGRPDGGSHDSGPDSASILLEEPTILYIQASSSEIEQMQARTPPGDFFTIADDMMFYRSEAFSVIERASVPKVTRVGRLRVQFVGDGEERTLDLSEIPWMDVIVLFDPGREPLILAPIDLSADSAVISQYFSEVEPFPDGY